MNISNLNEKTLSIDYGEKIGDQIQTHRVLALI
jgi:hypothetical protein